VYFPTEKLEHLSNVRCSIKINKNAFTIRCFRVVSTAASYVGGPGFKSQPPRPPVIIEVFRDFPRVTPGHDRFLP
jgi:hypothetical protein